MDFLKDILGAELYSQVESKINEHNQKEENKEKQIKLADLGSGNYVDKGKYHDLESTSKSNAEKLAEANKLIEDMKKNSKNSEEFNEKIAEYEKQLKEKDEQLAKEHMENAIKLGLIGAKANDVDYLTFKLKTGNNELKLDKEGKIQGWDEMIKSLKAQYPNQFESEAKQKVEVEKLPDTTTETNTGATGLASALKEYYQKD